MLDGGKGSSGGKGDSGGKGVNRFEPYDSQAPMVAIAVAGEVLQMSAERDGWLCTARPVAGGGERGWALRDGALLGLGTLLEACDV